MATSKRKQRHPLRAWRRAQSPWWSQGYLAERAGVPVWAVSKVETGIPIAEHHRVMLASFTGLYDALGVTRPQRDREGASA